MSKAVSAILNKVDLNTIVGVYWTFTGRAGVVEDFPAIRSQIEQIPAEDKGDSTCSLIATGLNYKATPLQMVYNTHLMPNPFANFEPGIFLSQVKLTYQR